LPSTRSASRASAIIRPADHSDLAFIKIKALADGAAIARREQTGA
jgi:hypothetical protein